MRKLKLIINLLILLLIMSACGSNQRLSQKAYLVKNKIKVDNKKVEESELHNLLIQKPNPGLLGSASKFRVYERKKDKKDNWWNRWIKRAFGAPPLYYDKSASETSIRQINRYLENKGFFKSKISHTVIQKRKKKIHILYEVKVNEPYHIKTINYQIEDSSLKQALLSKGEKSLLEAGMQYDAYLLDDERERITEILRNTGYYYFNKEFIRYDVDSTLGNKEMEVRLIISNASTTIENDSLQVTPHKKYRINNIYIYPEFNPFENTGRYDTLKLDYEFHPKDTTFSRIYFIHNGTFKVKPMSLARAVMFKSGDYFNNNNLNRSYSRFSGMNITKYVNIDFIDRSVVQDSVGLIDCRIRQSNKPIHAIVNGNEITNSSGNLGVALNVAYQNRNILKGAETINITATGAVEAQQQQYSVGEETGIFKFNTIEAGVEASFAVPRFMLPITPRKLSADFQPQTNITAGYHYQMRRDYTRFITNLSYSYKWKQNEKITHLVTPLEFNSVKINITNEDFTERLSNFDKRFREQYTDHLISAMRYTFLLNTQKRNQYHDYELFKWNIETSGNIINAYNHLANSPVDDNGNYSLLDIRYAQYIRTDIDYRHYNNITRTQSWANRAVIGIGIPYSNSDALPFEKAFAAGGANGMRGWQIRSLGPGGFTDTATTRFDQVGDLHIEVNSEYRFPVHGIFLGAVFVDAGNVWLLKESKDYPNGHFRFTDFYKQLAVDAGLGIRIDVSLFIVRLDMAIPIRDPGVEGNKWVGGDNILKLRNFNWNLGIGHTF